MKNQKETISQALQRQRRMMSLNGILDFSNISSNDFSTIGTQKALKTLIFDGSSISSLHTLPPQPSLSTISANNTSLNTLAGLATQPKLSSVSFINTPISKVENFRLSVLLAVGLRLSEINGSRVTKTERKMAKSYPPITKYLVNAGWIVTYPPPSEHDFRYLADQFEITGNDNDFVASVPAIEVKAKTIDGESFSPKKSDDDLSNEVGYDDSISFTEQMASLLQPLGFAIRHGPELQSDVLNAIRILCSTVKKVEEMSKM